MLACVHSQAIAHRSGTLRHQTRSQQKQKSENLSIFAFRTPSSCSGNALCARTSLFWDYGLLVVEQKCRIANFG